MENTFENLLNTISQEHKGFVIRIHNNFLNAGFKAQAENKAAGFFAVYKNPKTKKSAFNFFSRKNGLHVRLYPSYNSELVPLTDEMVAEIIQ